MVRMIRNVEPLPDELRYPRTRPQRGAEAARLRPLENPADQGAALPRGQLGWTARRGACLQSGTTLPAVGTLPSTHRPAIYPQALRDLVREQPLVEEGDGAETAAFQFRGTPLWTHAQHLHSDFRTLLMQESIASTSGLSNMLSVSMEHLAWGVSRTGLAPWVIGQAYRWVPITLLKSHLDRSLRRPPKDTALTYAIGHIVLRKEPWVIELYNVTDPIGPYPAHFRRFRGTIEKAFASRWCRKVVCISEHARRTVLENLDCSAFAHKVEVLSPAIAAKSGIRDYSDNGKVRLLFMGSANMFGEFAVRGGREVLEAFRILCQRYPNLELTIRSEVPPDVKRQIVNNKAIRLLDKILPFEELQREWSKRNIFLFPAYYGAWRIILEAFSYGLPVIATDVHDNSEYVADGRTGFLLSRPSHLPEYQGLPVAGLTAELRRATAKPDTKLVEDLVQRTATLIENPILRRQMGEAGRREVENGKLSLQRRNEKLKRIFDEAIGADR